MSSSEKRDSNGRVWEVVTDVECVECPDCGFAFASVHSYEDGEYGCPNCGNDQRDEDFPTNPDGTLRVAPEADAQLLRFHEATKAKPGLKWADFVAAETQQKASVADTPPA